MTLTRERLTVRYPPACFLDYSKNRITDKTLQLLVTLAQ